MDAWARDIVVQETQNSIVIGPAAKRITLEEVRINHAQPHSGAAAPADFSLAGSQILLNRCVVNGEGTWPVVTQATVSGPNVVLYLGGDAHAGVSPHQRWDAGWSVAWSVVSPFLLVQQPPGTMNWCIGCTGEEVRKDDPSGISDSRGAPVEPASLYLEQLRERLGEQAVVNIGYK